MSILDYTKQLHLFNSHEINIINILTKQYVDLDNQLFNYLKEVDFNQIEFYWYKDSNDDNLGGFYNLSYDSKTKKYAIYINMFFDYENRIDSFDIISMCLGTILHQLKHYYQLKKYGYILYGILQIPFIRDFTIEKSAYKISDYVDALKISEKMNAKQRIYLKSKYNIDKIYLTEQQKQIIESIKQKHIDITEIRKNSQLFNYKLIRLFLENK